MKIKSKPQVAHIELPFGFDPPAVYCPVCGKLMLDGEGEPSPCPHLVFMHIGAAGEFAWTSEDFDKRAEAANQDLSDWESIEKLLASLGYGANLLALELTYGGMSCGPIWFTDVFAFDYGIAAGKEGE